MKRKEEKPRGILLQPPAPGEITHERFLPSADLSFFVEHFWTVRWNLEGLPPRKVETIPHPTVHLVFENGATELGGVAKGKFSRYLEGNSFVFSVKFRPGAFYCFYKRSIAGLANKKIDPAIVFGSDFRSLEKAVLNAGSNETMFQLTENFFRKQLPPEDENVTAINELLATIIGNRSILRVDQLPEISGMNVRNLQRLFSRYLGVSPKWVIARYRIHESLERIREKEKIDWAGLAFDLGYSDQAHFIRDFKSLIGMTPLAYHAQKSAAS